MDRHRDASRLESKAVCAAFRPRLPERALQAFCRPLSELDAEPDLLESVSQISSSDWLLSLRKLSKLQPLSGVLNRLEARPEAAQRVSKGHDKQSAAQVRQLINLLLSARLEAS